jgi:hypothetical protein
MLMIYSPWLIYLVRVKQRICYGVSDYCMSLFVYLYHVRITNLRFTIVIIIIADTMG